MKKTTFLLLSLFISSASFAQQTGKAYTQTIPGTELTISMKPIPGGSFTMGDNTGKDTNASPAHKVSVAPFWMAEMEITWELYQLFMSREIDTQKPENPKGNEVNLDVDAVSGATTPYVEMSFGMGTDGYPAICMTQFAASKFCEWLSAMTGNFYRLPTEAEWEYAARAGSKTAYSFGNDTYKLNEYAWSNSNSNGKYHKVGTKKANAWGLHDMHGNVAEWTLDQYASYSKSNQKNPFVKPTKTYPRVVRGGSYFDDPDQLKSSARGYSIKEWKVRDPQIPKSKWWHTDAQFVGFRIVRPVDTPSAEAQKEYWKAKHTIK